MTTTTTTTQPTEEHTMNTVEETPNQIAKRVRRLAQNNWAASRTYEAAVRAKKRGDGAEAIRVLRDWAGRNPLPVRRSSDQITDDRDAAVAEISTQEGWVRGSLLAARRSYLDALVKDGLI
mgnify:FL=1